MFWSGNYIVVRELNFLLKEENVTLSQVLEADDILQECKADNKALIQFLTKPEILAELITLITEEPPKNLELATQYRHASIACEVLTSHLSMLSDRLSLDATQMNRLCDFINRDPPLNPLLASYFSKTVEMLLERSPKQDCYLYHIVCLRVLDFFKSRRDFLPNLLRHMSTSAIADTFKYFIRLDDLFKKTVMEWLEEHQFLECLIQIVCGTYVPEELSERGERGERGEWGERGEHSPRPGADADPGHDANHSGASDADCDNGPPKVPENNVESAAVRGEAEEGRAARVPGPGGAAGGRPQVPDGRLQAPGRARIAAVAAANAAALLCDLIANGCAVEGCATRGPASWALVRRLGSEAGVRALLQAMFTSPGGARAHALVHGCHLLRALLAHDPLLRMKASSEEELGRGAGTGAGGAGGGGAAADERSGVELALAPHLPLLHHALLHDPVCAGGGGGGGGGGGAGFVRAARVHVAALLAQLAQCELDDVPGTMLTLGTPGVLVDMFFSFPQNNFLHAQVVTLVRHALGNRVYRTQYARHLLVECDLLTRLMDVFEENQNNKTSPRAAYMGHVVLCLAHIARALAPPDLLAHALALPPALLERWQEFHDNTLRPLLQQHDTPLGGYYPSENIYEVEIMADTLAANYDFNDIAATGTMDELADDGTAEDGNEMCGAMGSSETPDFIADGLGIDDADKMRVAKSNFLELASQRFDDDMWEDSGDADAEPDEEAADAEPDGADGAVRDVLQQHSPWEGAAEGGGAGAAGAGGAGGGEGWAQFGAEALALAPHDPFAPAPAHFDDEQFAHAHDFTPFWPYDGHHTSDPELEASMRTLRLEGELTDKRMDEASSVELANNLLTAMSAMSADAIANIVNANLPDAPCDVTAAGASPPAADAADSPDSSQR